MKLGIIIQARMSSQRLPGKVLKLMGKQPLIQYLIDRVQQTNRPWVLATSDQIQDQALQDFCQKNQYPFFRGSLENVAERFLRAAEGQNWDAFVRISGDSPFLDPELIETVIDLFQQNNVDLATNVFPRSFPKGQSVEVISTSILRNNLKKMNLSEYIEHVTPYFYHNHHSFKIVNLLSDFNCSEQQLSVDTIEDWAHCEKLVFAMERPHIDYRWTELIQLKDRLQ